MGYGYGGNAMSSNSIIALAEPSPAVIGTGLVALDVVFDGPNPEHILPVTAGGTCGNVLAILSYLGWRAFPVARLSDDVAAQHIRRDLSQWGVRLDFVSSGPSSATPIYIQRMRRDAAGMPSHTFLRICPLCGHRLPGYQPIVLAAAMDVAAHIGYPTVFFLDRVSPGALVLAKESRARGAIIVFEPSGIGDPRLFREAVSLAHILKYSHERIERRDDDGAAPLLEVQTLGREGLRYRRKVESTRMGAWRHIPGFRIARLVDSAGSGDWCTAGLIHMLGQSGLTGFLKASSSQMYEALVFGQALAAWNCGFTGARGGMYESSWKDAQLAIERIIEGMHDDKRHEPERIMYVRDVSRYVCFSCGSAPL